METLGRGWAGRLLPATAWDTGCNCSNTSLAIPGYKKPTSLNMLAGSENSWLSPALVDRHHTFHQRIRHGFVDWLSQLNPLNDSDIAELALVLCAAIAES